MRHANNRSGVTQVAKSNEVSSVSPRQGTEDRNETAECRRTRPSWARGRSGLRKCYWLSTSR